MVPYITNIELKKLRNTPRCSIDIPQDKRTHLIITGPNGSGKTTFANQLYNALVLNPLYIKDVISNSSVSSLDQAKDRAKEDSQYNFYLDLYNKDILKKANELEVITSLTVDPDFYINRDLDKFLVYKSEAHREAKFKSPEGPKNLPDRTSGDMFIQLLVNMKAQMANAYMDADQLKDEAGRKKALDEFDEITRWYDNIGNALSQLFGHSDFRLDYDRKHFKISVAEKDKLPYEFTQLSDGYSAILKIVGDLMLAMSTDPLNAYSTPGVAIIDEIETHLHVALQRKILPFLTSFFPNIQFIVTTHSPFVLSSIGNAVIFDMETYKQYADFSQYSYTNIVEDYFNVSRFSERIMRELEEMKHMMGKESLDGDDLDRIRHFESSLDQMLGMSPLEIKNEWLQLKLDNIAKLQKAMGVV